MATEINEKLLDERLAALESRRSWTPRVIAKFENHIRSANDQDLFRINPCTFAAEHGMSEEESTNLYLHASALHLFEMDWFLICPLCSCVIDSFRALRNIDSHCYCSVCHVDFDAALDDQIAVGFTVSPEIRKISFHNPRELPVEDYYFCYRSTSEGLMPDGQSFTELKKTLTKALAFLEPGEKTTLVFDTEAGALLGTSPDSDVHFLFPIDGDRPPENQKIEIVCDDNSFDRTDNLVAPGRLTLEITHKGDKRMALSILQLPPDVTGPPPIHFANFLSGKKLLNTQTFRDIFRLETTDHGLGIKDITLLFTDLKGSTVLYDQIGDLNAFSLVQQHFERLQEVAMRNDGAIIKTIGDAVMAAFCEPAQAVRAALDMRDEISAVGHGAANRELILKIGLHKGAVIAVTLNDRLDYFGQTVNVAARIQHLADANEIYLSEDIFSSSGVDELLKSCAVEAKTAHLRGVDHEVQVFRVAPLEALHAHPV